MIELPDWIDPQTWADFEEMRRTIRKPLTDAARRLALKKLEHIYRNHGHRPTEVLEQSILNSWQGLWPISGGNGRSRKDEEWRREARVGVGPVTWKCQ